MPAHKNGKTKTVKTSASRFARNVCKLRVKKNLSQTAFGKRIGITASYVSMLERNKRTPTLETVDRIAKGYRVKATDLIS